MAVPSTFVENRGPMVACPDRLSPKNQALLWGQSTCKRRLNVVLERRFTAMVGLAKIRTDAKVGDGPTILRLFTDSGNAPALGLSTWDRAYLKALYHTKDDTMQLSEIKISVIKDVAR